MANRKFLLHYLLLAAVILLGAILRFWNLDLKPYWQDEVITALFSLGRSYKDVPLDVVLPLTQVEQIFTLNPGTSCAQIAHNVATQSTHPPLFFCLLHKWAEAPLVGVMARGWVWSLRALPALCGVGAIAALYCLNRVAFSPAAGLAGAAFMAVSPFAVYLSQEARHYTLPILAIALALLALIQIQRDLFQAPYKIRPWVWIAWVAINIIGLYIHYFFILAAIAQLGTLLGLMYWQRRILPRYSWVATGLAVATVGCGYFPWLPVLLRHFSHSEHNWLPPPQNIFAPLLQTLISWLFMVIALPVEDQPLWIAVPSGLLMVVFGGWLAWYVARGLWQLWNTPATHLATLTLLSFTFWVLLEFFAIAYLLGKDLTSVPRYDFVYYPSICALLGASLLRRGQSDKATRRQGEVYVHSPITPSSPHHPIPPSPHLSLSLLVGVLSCIFVVSNWVLQKPFYPERVAQNLNQEPTVPLMVVVGYIDHEAAALGLSFALALDKIRSEDVDFALFNPTPAYRLVWEHLSVLPPPKVPKLNLWVIGPGLRQQDYPQHLALSRQATCTLDPKNFHRIGVPYQLYRCVKL
ncbi:MAG: glycosyltransferase family 39 protein [Chroococcidiopsidaceae cyanobacterium CP_BM_ER_R8_30]|nr:glycosyltransferase family 39 protein [Chroococcidiopsidaceae cyanobacterium CP_BM_ER_R8_30]